MDDEEDLITDPMVLVETFLKGSSRSCCRRVGRTLCDFHAGWAGGMEWGIFIAQAFADVATRARAREAEEPE